MPGLLDFFDWCDLLSFLLQRFGIFGGLSLRLSLGLLLCGFRLLRGLRGWYWGCSWCRGLGVSRLFGRSRSAVSSRDWLLLGLGGLGPLLTGGLVDWALLAGWRLVTRRAHWLVLGRWMRHRKRWFIKAAT